MVLRKFITGLSLVVFAYLTDSGVVNMSEIQLVVKQKGSYVILLKGGETLEISQESYDLLINQMKKHYSA
jgi:hypothetical protein